MLQTKNSKEGKEVPKFGIQIKVLAANVEKLLESEEYKQTWQNRFVGDKSYSKPEKYTSRDKPKY